MKKSAALFLMMSLFLAGCEGEHNNSVIPNNSANQNGSNNQDGNGGNEGSHNDIYLEADITYHVETVCFYTEESLDVANYFTIVNETEKEINTKSELEAIYNKIQAGKDNNLVSFTDGEKLQNIDFNQSKIILFPIIRNSVASYFNIRGTSLMDVDKIKISLEETVEVENDSKYCTVGFVYAIVLKDKNYTINVFYTKNNNDQTITFKKPIVYFYPEREMDITIRYGNENNLLTTYPKYNDGWDIHLKKDGTFVTKDSDREYYAIYFDEIANFVCDFKEGFYVNKDNAIKFLEEKMDYIGYTNREVDEFMMYWLPILENNEHSLVYFEQTEERNEECPLIFSTEPDTLIRTIIHIKKVDAECLINEQQLKHYDRNGFVVTEWGGTEY